MADFLKQKLNVFIHKNVFLCRFFFRFFFISWHLRKVHVFLKSSGFTKCRRLDTFESWRYVWVEYIRGSSNQTSSKQHKLYASNFSTAPHPWKHTYGVFIPETLLWLYAIRTIDRMQSQLLQKTFPHHWVTPKWTQLAAVSGALIIYCKMQ